MSNLNKPLVSIVIRTFNEEKFLSECLQAVCSQSYQGPVEILIVDSGSTDRTLEIAGKFNTKIVSITKVDFTFGRSLNRGCIESKGEIIVILSAHCIPINQNWLEFLINPILNETSEYSYGRQLARSSVSKFSESMVFEKYYPKVSAIPQVGYFCNNANSAISKTAWECLQFDENLTGLEDMELAKRLVANGGSVSYVSSSCVEHIHEETWDRVKIRYEREAVALSVIDPKLCINIFDAGKMFIFSVLWDIKNLKNRWFINLREILFYRFCQFWGAYVGSQVGKKRIRNIKNEYFYPSSKQTIVKLGIKNEDHRSIADESS